MIKQYYVFLLEDGNHLIHEIDIPSIKTTLYYDDELEAPSKEEDSFIDYNMYQNSPLRCFENKRLFIYESKDKTFVTFSNGSYDEPAREATEERMIKLQKH